jgi:hypothetical protein
MWNSVRWAARKSQSRLQPGACGSMLMILPPFYSLAVPAGKRRRSRLAAMTGQVASAFSPANHRALHCPATLRRIRGRLNPIFVKYPACWNFSLCFVSCISALLSTSHLVHLDSHLLIAGLHRGRRNRALILINPALRNTGRHFCASPDSLPVYTNIQK